MTKDIKEEILKGARICPHCGGNQKRVESLNIEWVCENKKCKQRYIIPLPMALDQAIKSIK